MRTACTSPTLEVIDHILLNPNSCCNLLWTSQSLLPVLNFCYCISGLLPFLQLNNLCTLPSVKTAPHPWRCQWVTSVKALPSAVEDDLQSVWLQQWQAPDDGMTCVYAGDGLVTGDTVHDMYMYCRWWLALHDRCMKGNWWLSRVTMRTGEKTD